MYRNILTTRWKQYLSSVKR